MRTRYDRNGLFLLVLLVLSVAATAAEAQVQPELAKRYFEEATKLCERDAGGLWGVSLGGPMVIFDQATGTRATSPFRSMGPTRRQRRRPVGYRWGHSVRAGCRTARRDHLAGGGLECHCELRMGGAAGGASWLIRDRSFELVRDAEGLNDVDFQRARSSSQ